MKFRFFLGLLIAAVLLGGALLAPAGAAAEEAEVLNDYDPSLWTFSEGMTATVLSEEGKNTAVRMESGSGFTASAAGCDGTEFMIDFTLGLDGLGEESLIVLRLFKGEETFAQFTLRPGEGSYSVTLDAGGEQAVLDGVAYGGSDPAEGRIQVRLAYDELLDLETQTRSDGWNFVAGCSKLTNGQLNVFSGNAGERAVMQRMGEFLSAADREDLTFEIRTSGFTACRIDLAQLNADCYYDYYLLPAPAVASEEDIYYNRAAFSWALPDAEAFPRAGFRVERYCGEVLEQTYIYDNAYASSLSETTLKQNTEYTYRVTAYEEVDSVLNAVACYRVAFQYRPLTIRTLQGHFWYFIVAMIVLLAVLAAVILGYVYYYDIKKKLKKRT